jgi:glucose/arabinose dehydrogenase
VRRSQVVVRAVAAAAIAIAIAIAIGACGSGSSVKTTSPIPIPPTSPAPPTSTTAKGATSPSSTAPPAGAPGLVRAHVALVAVATGLDSPIALAWRAHDPRMFVAEQRGRVRTVDANGRVSPTPVLTVGPLSTGNEEGLLGITFSPDGSKLYVDYTAPDDNTHVDEYTMRGDLAVASTRRQVLVQQQPYSNHKGGEVLTGPDGMLYIGLGDGGSENDPQHVGQNLGTLLSKILRINPAADGSSPYSVPADNPFVGRSGTRPETWMWGLRNPWRFSFDRATGDLWIGDVGQNKYEEIDVARAGEKGINWGWSAREGFHAFHGSPVSAARDPLLETTHSDGNCAIVGGYVYRGRAMPALDGVYVFGDDCRPNLVGVAATDGHVVAQRDLGPTVDALTTFGEDPVGELYAVARGGTVYRLTPG